ncbi:hypothetical protein [Euzebya sp.]|uniref:hypothetical protein n=1 Tax=Euzebya sp. TaxID=1971409 RepID=UPI0035176E8A
MSDPSAQGQPTQEEIEAYYAQLREAPAGDLLMQCVGMLASGAEAKLGRGDARLLIDALAAMVGAAEPHLGSGVEQLKTAVSQLQMAQVQLERQQASGGEQPAEGEGTSTPPPGQASGGQASSGPAPGGPAPGGQPKQTDKLWIPGRDG